MALDMEVLKQRLREILGNDSQENVGKKLNMTQGNVSKLLSGTQQPTLESIYHIAGIYDVSVDWILGLSDKKSIAKNGDETTYETAVKSILDLIHRHTAEIDFSNNRAFSIKIEDPLADALTRKGKGLADADWASYLQWRNTRLSMFESKPLLFDVGWEYSKLLSFVGPASSEAHWLEVYNEALDQQENFFEIVGDDPGPFGDMQ